MRKFSLSNFHLFVDLLFKLSGLKSLIFDKNKSNSVQKLSTSSLPWFGDLCKHENKPFLPWILISKTKHSFKLHKSSLLMTGRCSS